MQPLFVRDISRHEWVNPLMLKAFFENCRLELMKLLTITFELGIILQNIRRRVVGNVLINISPSNILPIVLKPERFLQNGQAGFGRCEHEWVKHACFKGQM